MSGFLDLAFAIARRICRDAIWADSACNWIGPFMDGFNVWDIRQKSFGADLYSGTSGVALFLASVEQLVHERLVRKTAEGAALHAYNHVDDFPPAQRIAVYSGTIGVAWALIRIGKLLGNSSWEERGLELLDRVDANVTDAGLDVMSGCAGAIPIMLELSRQYARPEWADLASRWGDGID